MKIKLFVFITFLFTIISLSKAQTASSLFHLNDSLQVNEIVSKTGDMYSLVGHHGPAVENSHMALCIYFNDSGAIDLYSKTARGMELLKYSWYPSLKSQQDYFAGCDQYEVGNTLGFGGIGLWDGEKIVRLIATKGRTAKVSDHSKESFAQIISYGVVCGSDTLDISVTVRVHAKKREARLIAEELSGKKVCFVTGINYFNGHKVVVGEDYAFVWGIHPIEGIKTSGVGAGIRFNPKKFEKVEKTDDMVRMISFPASSVTTTLIGASTKEAELNSLKRFETYMRD